MNKISVNYNFFITRQCPVLSIIILHVGYVDGLFLEVSKLVCVTYTMSLKVSLGTISSPILKNVLGCVFSNLIDSVYLNVAQNESTKKVVKSV